MAEKSAEQSKPQQGTDARSAPPAKRKKPSLMKQANMKRMLIALSPLLLSAIYFFGWRALAVTAVVFVAGTLTEYITSKQRGQPISMACWVTCMLLSLSLPPTVPYYVAVIGAVVAILFGKEVFGGFGRNFVNPTILGRAFLYVCFPLAMTNAFVPAFQGVPGGFAEWSFPANSELPQSIRDGAPPEAFEGKTVADAVSQASPMWVYRDVGKDAFEQGAGYRELFWGDMNGAFQQDGRWRILSAGSMGEACVPLILLAAAYLLWTKTANWRLMLSAALGLGTASVLFRQIFGFTGPGGVPPLAFNLMAGTTLYVLVFMVTDPVSAPKQTAAQWAYGLIIGFCVVFMRWKGPFVAAASFALLFGNIVGPLLDIGAEEFKRWRKDRAKQAPAPAEAPAAAPISPARTEGGEQA
jgi:Na+-transporting NADH:ubiquinone oxidoreductase subunit B